MCPIYSMRIFDIKGGVGLFVLSFLHSKTLYSCKGLQGHMPGKKQQVQPDLKGLGLHGLGLYGFMFKGLGHIQAFA